MNADMLNQRGTEETPPLSFFRGGGGANVPSAPPLDPPLLMSNSQELTGGLSLPPLFFLHKHRALSMTGFWDFIDSSSNILTPSITSRIRL